MTLKEPCIIGISVKHLERFVDPLCKKVDNLKFKLRQHEKIKLETQQETTNNSKQL